MKRPILIMVFGYIVGIVIGLYCKISVALFYPLVLLIPFIFKILSKKFKTCFNKYSRVLIDKKLICVFVVTSIISNTVVLYLNSKYEKIYQIEGKGKFTAIVISEPVKKDYYTKYKIKVQNSSNNILKNSVLYLNIKEDIELEYGEKVLFSGEYEDPEVRRNYKGFSYRDYLKSIGIVRKYKCEQSAKTRYVKSKSCFKICE